MSLTAVNCIKTSVWMQNLSVLLVRKKEKEGVKLFLEPPFQAEDCSRTRAHAHTQSTPRHTLTQIV